jgi:LPXTG-motif cell wall-anchored protein
MDVSDAPLELEDSEQPDIAAEMDSLPADPFGESGAQDVPPPTEELADSSQPTEPETSTFGMADTPSSDTYETSDSSTTIVDSGDEPVKKNVPLQKIPTSPWKVGKSWFNTVYFAKPGDSLAQISRTIYGEDRTEELKRGNPTFNSRDVKPGDKVYYNSPNRPDDSSRLITYYEDNGMSPEVYVARDGDNIRTVSKNLLGYDNAWKEIWASNSVESKGEISEGTELRYWKGGAVAAAPRQARQETAPPAQVEQMPPQQAEIPPPPMPEDQPPMDMGGMPQDPAMDMAAQDQLPPPPPPMEESINPPPPPPQMVAEEDRGAPATDEDTTLALAVVGLAAAGLAILIVMRKKRRQRELEQQAMDNTHVGT